MGPDPCCTILLWRTTTYTPITHRLQGVFRAHHRNPVRIRVEVAERLQGLTVKPCSDWIILLQSMNGASRSAIWLNWQVVSSFYVGTESSRNFRRGISCKSCAYTLADTPILHLSRSHIQELTYVMEAILQTLEVATITAQKEGIPEQWRVRLLSAASNLVTALQRPEETLMRESFWVCNEHMFESSYVV